MQSTLANDSIALHYQPLVGRGGKPAGFEALMRWHHRQRGSISPEAFIPVFEENGLMLPLSRWALALSCRHAAAWPEPIRVWVNVSLVELRSGELLATVRNALAMAGLAASRLELEFRESTLRGAPEAASRLLPALADLGVGITLDRFSNGSAADALLRRYPIGRVKIDGGLVGGLETTPAAASILRMLIELAHSQHCEVAAAGIETEAQRAFLVDLGCDLFQGFLIGRPAPIDDYAHIVGQVRRSDAGNDSDLAIEHIAGLAATTADRRRSRAHPRS